MAKPGPKAQPYLKVVREGNPSKKKVTPGAVVAAGELEEPNWADTFTTVRVPALPKKPDPDDEDAQFEYKVAMAHRSRAQRLQDENRRAREIARREWRRVIPVLVKSVGLANVDTSVAQDYCICVARIDMCERGLSRDGMMVLGERGWMKNGLTTIVGQYRTQLKVYIGELGLSPSSRTGIEPGGGDGDGDDDPFD